MFCPSQNTSNFRKGGCPPAGPTGPPGPTGPAGPTGDNNLIIVRSVLVTHTDLASNGTKVLFAAESPTASYTVLNIYIVSQGASQWVNGNRQILITDNVATSFGSINQTTLTNISYTSYGYIASGNDTYGIFYPTNDPLAVSNPGSNIICKYNQGTTDYTSGQGYLSMVLYRVTP